MRMRWILFLSLLLIALTSCGTSPMKPGDTPTSTLLKPEKTIILSTHLPPTPKQWDDVPIDPPLSIPTNAGLPVLVEKAKADLAHRLAVSESDIKTTETKEAVWPDASLGCPQPDIAYAQIPIPGYIILLMHAGDKYEYHVDIHGNIIYCENPTPPISGTPADITPFPIVPP